MKEKECKTKIFGIQSHENMMFVIRMILFSEVKLRIKAKNVDIDADHFQQVTLNGFHIFFWNKRN